MSLILCEDADGVPTEVDESALVKTEGIEADTDDYTKTWVEYRFPGSDRIVHRSVAVQFKKWPDGMGALTGSFG